MKDIVINYGAYGRVRLERRRKHVAQLRLEVHPAFHRQGIGTELVNRAIASAHIHGIKRIEATPYCDNPVSSGFFFRHPEFELEGIRRGGGEHNGEPVDTYLFAWVES